MSEAVIAAQTAIARQNFALDTFKTANEQVQQLANIVEEGAQNAAVTATRGNNVNITA